MTTTSRVTAGTADKATVEDVRDFAASVRDICAAHPTADAWTPEKPCDDRNPALRDKLTSAGWFQLGSEPDGVDFLGAAGAELGRALVSVDSVDALLGHGIALAPSVAGGKALARYAEPGEILWLCNGSTAEPVEVVGATPVSHLDAQCVSLVETAPLPPERLPATDIDAWFAAMTGYLAGLAVGALDLAMEHATSRMAFGKPLSAIDSVASKLADSACTAEGLRMAAMTRPPEYVVLHAATAVSQVMKDSHQILGALGFTLEFPLQRYSRRAAALKAWTTPVVRSLAGTRRQREAP